MSFQELASHTYALLGIGGALVKKNKWDGLF